MFWGFRESLVVRSLAAAASPALRSVRFTVTGTGLDMATSSDGGLNTTDASGRQLFIGPPARMWDSGDGDPAGAGSPGGRSAGGGSALLGERVGSRSAPTRT